MTAKEFLLTHTYQSNEENLIEFAKLHAKNAYDAGWEHGIYRMANYGDDELDVDKRDEFLEKIK